MLKELESNEYERVRSLFQGFDYSLSILAAIEGNNPGRIFVDDADRPHTALAFTVEGYLLTGDHDNPATNEALRCLLREKIFTGEVFVNDENPDYYYHLAASAWAILGNKEKALKYLHAAADCGWAQVEWTKQQEKFSILHGTPEWDTVLARMENGAQD